MKKHKNKAIAAHYFGLPEARMWLANNRVKYDEILFGKPSAELYVDNKACLVRSYKGVTDWDDNFWPAIESIKHANICLSV